MTTTPPEDALLLASLSQSVSTKRSRDGEVISISVTNPYTNVRKIYTNTSKTMQIGAPKQGEDSSESKELNEDSEPKELNEDSKPKELDEDFEPRDAPRQVASKLTDSSSPNKSLSNKKYIFEGFKIRNPKVECPLCSGSFYDYEMRVHTRACPRRVIECKNHSLCALLHCNGSCDWVGEYTTFSQHIVDTLKNEKRFKECQEDRFTLVFDRYPSAQILYVKCKSVEFLVIVNSEAWSRQMYLSPYTIVSLKGSHKIAVRLNAPLSGLDMIVNTSTTSLDTLLNRSVSNKSVLFYKGVDHTSSDYIKGPVFLRVAPRD